MNFGDLEPDEEYVPTDADELAKYKRRVETPDKFDQPMSKPNINPTIIAMVIDDVKLRFGAIWFDGVRIPQTVAALMVQDLQDREALGIKRYGVALQPFNGRDPTKDAYTEALDLCNYLGQDVYEARVTGNMKRLSAVLEEYGTALTLARSLRSRIAEAECVQASGEGPQAQ